MHHALAKLGPLCGWAAVFASVPHPHTCYCKALQASTGGDSDGAQRSMWAPGPVNPRDPMHPFQHPLRLTLLTSEDYLLSNLWAIPPGPLCISPAAVCMHHARVLRHARCDCCPALQCAAVQGTAVHSTATLSIPFESIRLCIEPSKQMEQS